MAVEDEGSDWEDYSSGPFCRHWGDPSDCEETCAECGHRCGIHYGDDGECHDSGCKCLKWVEP